VGFKAKKQKKQGLGFYVHDSVTYNTSSRIPKAQNLAGAAVRFTSESFFWTDSFSWFGQTDSQRAITYRWPWV